MKARGGQSVARAAALAGALLGGVAGLFGSTGCQAVSAPWPEGFVDASQEVPGLIVEARYAGTENFIGRPIAGYEGARCLLTMQAASALKAAQQELARFGLGLKTYDCYRPQRAVDDFVRWSQDPADQARKADFYPRVDKAALFALGFIAARSGHSRGSTVDLTLVVQDSGEELDMGSRYDLFDERSAGTHAGMTPQQRANRMLLQTVMRQHGFRPYRLEWWHFTLMQEPHPETFFDFPVPAGR